MENLASRIIWMSEEIKRLHALVDELQKQIEEQQKNKPYSKTKQQPKFENMDMVYHDGYWKNYAVYKDEEEA